MNKLWYQLEYEDDETQEFNRVLYTSKEGLTVFIDELQKIPSQADGRYKFLIKGLDEDYESPFDYIELTNNPPSQTDDYENESRIFYIIVVCLLAILLLAAVGLISAIMWIFF